VAARRLAFHLSLPRHKAEGGGKALGVDAAVAVRQLHPPHKAVGVVRMCIAPIPLVGMERKMVG
jgi:hypothetical protein